MRPPEAEDTGNPPGPALDPAVCVLADADCRPVQALAILRQRADFLRAASARRQGATGFLLQARRRDGATDNPATTPTGVIRVGFTCSRKIGNAVARNRAKRRLREVARLTLPQHGRAGWDYVLVGRPGATIDRPFALLLSDLEAALRQVHGGRPGK